MLLLVYNVIFMIMLQLCAEIIPMSAHSRTPARTCALSDDFQWAALKFAIVSKWFPACPIHWIHSNENSNTPPDCRQTCWIICKIKERLLKPLLCWESLGKLTYNLSLSQLDQCDSLAAYNRHLGIRCLTFCRPPSFCQFSNWQFTIPGAADPFPLCS